MCVVSRCFSVYITYREEKNGEMVYGFRFFFSYFYYSLLLKMFYHLTWIYYWICLFIFYILIYNQGWFYSLKKGVQNTIFFWDYSTVKYIQNIYSFYLMIRFFLPLNQFFFSNTVILVYYIEISRILFAYL